MIEYEKYLKNNLSEKRYNHCIRTAKKARELCEIHNIPQKAIIAALLHDIAKELELEEMIELVGDRYKQDIDGMYTKNILHGYSGARLCELVFGIEDEDILSAIRYHTTGKKNMNDIEKVVYLSDAIEDGREYEGVEKIRQLAKTSVDDAIILEIEYKLENLKKRKIEIHKNTLEFLETLKLEKR